MPIPPKHFWTSIRILSNPITSLIFIFLNVLFNHLDSSYKPIVIYAAKLNTHSRQHNSLYQSRQHNVPCCCPCFFVWTAAWNKILTCDNLRKRGYNLPSWCCMCHCNGESVDHLLLHCPTAGGLWSWIFQTFGVHWVLPGTVTALLFSWWNGLGRHSSDIWNIVPACLMWTIWKERNHQTFEDVSKLDSQLLEGFSLTLFDWSRAWGFSTSTSIPDFISSLFLISHDVYSWCVSVHALCTLHFIIIKSVLLPIKKKSKPITKCHDSSCSYTYFFFW